MKAGALNSGSLIDNLIKSNKGAPKRCAFCCQLVLDFISEPHG
nr:MAG TPA: Cytochrome c oxidase subunit 1 [Caudoviricetes sp.]